MLLDYKGKRPKIGKNVFIAHSAVLIGDVTIEDGTSIWYGAVLRGDMSSIYVDKNSNIQDNCTVHTDYEKPVTIGKLVTVGHNAVIHGCRIEDRCLIGFNSNVLNGGVVKEGSIVGAGSLVKENQVVGPRHLVAGLPAVFKKELPADMPEALEIPARTYMELAVEHIKTQSNKNLV